MPLRFVRRSSRRLVLPLAVAAAGLVGGLAPRPAAAATSAQIDAAIAKAKSFLYSLQKPDGSWEYAPARDPTANGASEVGGQWGGKTAVIAYALIAAGEDVHSPKLAKAIGWLRKADMVGVYALGTRCQVWLLMPQTDDTRKHMRADADALSVGFNGNSRSKTGYLYGYLANRKELRSVDHSSSQFGVLGMWASEQLRPESVPNSYWSEVDTRWVHDQQPDGGWLYSDGVAPTGVHSGTQASMTAAGVATLFITQDYVGPGQSARCGGNATSPTETAIDKGLAYMATHLTDWTPDVPRFGSPTAELYSCYTLYGVERIGVASGLKYIGTTDWYEYGADWCVAHQGAEGAWVTPTDTDNTALALLFLARGRAPILINKVQYDDADGPNAGKPGHWNERPRDVANLVRWAGRQTERDLNWQVTNLKVPEAELHDAPFLYLAGNQALRLAPDQRQKLKQFCEQGGTILFNADCGANTTVSESPFTASVVALGRELFPAYEFRDLPSTSPVYAEQFTPGHWKRPPTIRALSNGVREMMFILPTDPAKAWQLRQTLGAGKEEAFQSMQDVILYATDKQPLRVKGIPFLVAVDDKVKAEKKVVVGRLKYAGNWDPEPGGWRRLGAVLHNRFKTDLDVRTVELGHDPLKADAVQILHLTGTTPVRLSGPQQAELKDYLDGGGTLVVDVAGGPTGPSAAFAQSVESLIGVLYPKGLSAPLPPNDPIFSRVDPKDGVRYRPYARLMLGKLNVPQVKAVTVKGRPAVYYSREDLSGGLVGEDVDGIVGYDPATATDIMAGILLNHTVPN